MKYIATINVPGYLPETEPLEFDTAQEAWSYLADERERGEDSWNIESEMDYSDTWSTLRRIAGPDHVHGDMNEDHPTSGNGSGIVHGNSHPEKIHDLGLFYSVEAVQPKYRVRTDVHDGSNNPTVQVVRVGVPNFVWPMSWEDLRELHEVIDKALVEHDQ